MKKLLTFVLFLTFLIGIGNFTGLRVKADDQLVNSILNLSIQPSPQDFNDIQLKGFSTLEYGDLVCSIDITNRSLDNDYRVPIYVLGKDSYGNVIEVGSTCVNIGKTTTYKEIKQSDGTLKKVIDENNVSTIKKVLIKLKAGFLIKSLETGIVGQSNDKLVIKDYGIRRDDNQNKIVVTAIVKDNLKYPFSKDNVEILQNGGIVATGYDKVGNKIEVQGATSNIPNGSIKTFEVTFLAGSLIDHVRVSVTGNSDFTINNIYGNRVEKGKNIITGNFESNPFSQFVQIVAKGYSKGEVVAIDGQTIPVDKNANGNYRFEMDQSNNIDKVEVSAREQKNIMSKAELVTYSTHTENSKIIVDALVSSGYYKDKNLGIIATGLDGQNKIVETNTQVIAFQGNKSLLQHVTTTLEAGKQIKKVNVELAGTMDDDIKLVKCGYRVENGTYLVTSIIENGNTVAQTAGVKVIGYNQKDEVIEVSGYSDTINANSTKQYKSILTNTKDISRVDAQIVGLVKGKIQEQHAQYQDGNTKIVSGILLNGNAQHNGGFIAQGLDNKGNIVDIDCFYNSLNENTVTPFILKLNDAKRIASVKTYTVEAGGTSPNMILDGAGYFLDKDRLTINSVITNGTTLVQPAGLVSIGYDTKGTAVDIAVTQAFNVNPLTTSKFQNYLSNIKQISKVKTTMLGVKCPTDLFALITKKDPNSPVVSYNICIRNGSADQNFVVKLTSYDLKGKLLPESSQNVQIQKYGAQVFNFTVDTANTSQFYLKVYDSTNKQVRGKGISDLIYKK